MFNDEEGEPVQTEEEERMYQTSVSHSVITPDTAITETEIPMMTYSMVAHCHSPPMEDSLPELGSAITSLQAHTCQDQHLVPAQECQEEVLEECKKQEDILPDVEICYPDKVSIDEKVYIDVEEKVTFDVETESQVCIESFKDYLQELEIETRENDFYLNVMDQEDNYDEMSFLTSMVSHQLPNLAPQEEFPAAIMSSASHHQIKIETEEIESNTSMLSHFTESFYDSGNFEDVNEEELTELTEDALYDFTEYTEEDHLDTIIEVSEMCITDAAEMTESELFEDTEDYSMYSIVEEKINLIPEPEIVHSYSFDMSYGNVTSDYCQSYTEDDQSYIEEEEESCCSEYQVPLIDKNELFLPSMVAHQLPLHDTPLEFHALIMSMTSHMTTPVEEDYQGTGTTSLCHFTRCDSGFIEEEPEEEAVEDFTEYTDVYTEADHLDTIQEVSEMCDTTDLTEMTETELFEEMEEFVNFSESIDYTNCPYDMGNRYSTIQESGFEEESHESIAETMEETSAQYEDIKSNPELEEDEIDEEGDFLPSMVSHCVNTSEDDYTMLPSPATHNILMVTETNDFNSMVSFQQPSLNEDTLEEEENQEQESITTSIETEYVTEIGLIENSDQNFGTEKEAEFISEEDSPLPQEYQSCQEPANSSTPETTINEESEQEDGKNTVQSYKLQLTRIQELQKLVEDELEEFDTKRKCKPINIEQATESQIVNIVKGVEFVTNIKINQFYENFDQSIMPQMLPSPLPIRRVTIEQQTENTSQEKKKTIELFSDEEEEDNLVVASCTLRGDNTVSIRSSYAGSDDLDIESGTEEAEIKESLSDKKEEELEQINESSCDKKEEPEQDREEKKDDCEDKLNEVKIPIRAPPRKSVISERRIREKELLDSMLAQTETTDKPQNILMTDNNEEKKDLTSILKPSKTTVKVASATVNESSSKQSYRIKFKVKLNENSERTQTSVLRYLFGCFGGEKLFSLQHK